MASFQIAYDTYIKPFEGGYVNIAADKGGETYAGIARNKFPLWEGWAYIDFEKKTRFAGTEIPRNTYFPDIQYMVDSFYEARWNNFRLDEFKNQNLASFMFDYIVHSGVTKAVTALQRILNVNVDGIIGPQTIGAANRADPVKTIERLINERTNFLRSLIAKDPTQQVFESGWMKRMATFRAAMLPRNGSNYAILAAAILFGVYIFNS